MRYFVTNILKLKLQRNHLHIAPLLSCTEYRKPKEFFITTPIFYVNGRPHLGHLYSAVIADAAQRFQKLLHPDNNRCLFSTGTDEHGLKVQKAAQAVGQEPSDFSSSVSSSFKSLFLESNIQFTNFLRTTDKSHKIAVEHFLETLYDKGMIYKDLYQGWYCVSDESFLTDKQVIKKQHSDGTALHVSRESGHPVEWSREVNYIFKLSSFKNQLLQWLENKSRIVPPRFSEELKSWISSGLSDLSISRPKSRISWGVPIPWDRDHTAYVWVDALVNYLTVAGYPNLKLWPPDLQIIGKDILRFHGIYWPALLMAAGLDPPEQLHVHSHWLVENYKMSKSLGNVLCPKELSQKFSVDGVRYILLRNGTPHSDCSWNEEKVVRDLNSELANTLGNLLNRLTAKSLNPHREFPSIDPSLLVDPSSTCKNLVERMNKLSSVVEKHFLDYNFFIGIEYIMDMLRTANLVISDQKPWDMKNNPDRSQLDFVIALGLSAAKMAGIALQPVIPSMADNLLSSLGISNYDRTWSALENPLTKSKCSKLGKKIILFKKL